jgi:5'-3' exonuclease
VRSPIKDFYPLDFKIDFEGKRNEWEGVVQARTHCMPFTRMPAFTAPLIL